MTNANQQSDGLECSRDWVSGRKRYATEMENGLDSKQDLGLLLGELCDLRMKKYWCIGGVLVYLAS
ncbi:hypothetical protein Hanom_Chr07g00642081 [Helianthus anomalus]